jgi:hypothetical protein
MKAKDMEFGAIAEAITIEVIQAKIVEEYPHFFLDRRDGRIYPTTAASLGCEQASKFDPFRRPTVNPAGRQIQ